MAGTRITVTPAGEAVCAALGVATAADLMSLESGSVVAQSRTTKTMRLATPAGNAYLKRYFVPTFKDWFRGALRWTWLGKSKARREWENYARLQEVGWGIPERLAWADVASGAGALQGCAILTAEVPEAERLDVAWLKGGIDRRSLLNALADRLRVAFQAGWCDRNLHARNILVRHGGSGWELFKIDSPKGIFSRSQWEPSDDDSELEFDLAALDAFARHACTPRERLRVLVAALRFTDRGNRRIVADNVNRFSQELQGREQPRYQEALELAGV
ncbi:MAG: lipopolysaccharide kinase InaA family protein [Planctomycetota bacterium]|jgi:hypothetical protein